MNDDFAPLAIIRTLKHVLTVLVLRISLLMPLSVIELATVAQIVL